MAAGETPRPGVNTPQFRTMLLRRLKSLFPSLKPDIQPLPNGVTFQLFDEQGDAKTPKLSIYSHHANALERAYLLRLVGNVEA